MKTYTIHFIRHGLTKGAIDGKYIGQTDEELCKEGIEQIKQMKEEYGYPYPEVVFTSSLKRCIDTAKLIYPEKDGIIMRGFDEYDFGEFEGHTAAELEKYDEFKDWLSGGEDARALNGESNGEFATRVCNAFQNAVDGMIKSGIGSASIITHGGVIMSILAAFGVPELPMTEWLTPSACGYTVRITPSLWSQIKKVEVINEVPAMPLTAEQEEQLWDYYPDLPEDDSWNDNSDDYWI